MLFPRGLGALVALALLIAPAASARTLKAETILPPGQSGQVDLTGVTSGTGSPHLYDQVEPFVNFRYKPAMFNGPGTESTTPRPGVTIVRDAYGVPAITASNQEDAWYGVGYAVAQDRLFQLELFRRATTGRLAEILGTSYLDDDLIARRDYYTAPELQAMYNAMPVELKARATAYRQGVNDRIAEVRNDPFGAPGEFVALGVPYRDFNEIEQTAIGVFLARTVPSGDGNELSNLALLRGAGRKALDALVPIRQKSETYTIMPGEATFKSQPGRTLKHERAAFDRSVKASAAWDLPSPKAAAQARADVLPGLLGHKGGSYMFAMRDPKTRHTFLFNGPQLGYSTPELFVEFELHYPGVDLRGVSAAGVPVMGIGHNDHIAWGFTSGLSDEDDLYAEALVGDTKAETYRFRGEEKKMDCRDERFAYSTPVTDVAGGTPPESGSITERVCRTVHGPVQVRAGDTAYARRYAIWGRELETIVGIDQLNLAESIADVDAAMREVTWNENVLAIDDRGRIGYWHPGLHQLRPRRFDERLPYPGTGEAEWRGLRPRATDPHIVDPRRNYLANWNNLPARGWTTGDAESNERLSGIFHRGQFLLRVVRGAAKAPSYEAAKRALSYVGTTAQQRPLALVRLRRAQRGATGQAQQVLDALRAWDGSYHRVDGARTVDPGVAIWEEFKDQLELIALKKLSPDTKVLEPMAGGTGSSHMFDISNGEAYALRTTTPAEWRAAATATFGVLEKKFATGDVSKWREPRRLYPWSAQGAGSPPDLPFFDRGTWEQFVEMGQ